MPLKRNSHPTRAQDTAVVPEGTRPAQPAKVSGPARRTGNVTPRGMEITHAKQRRAVTARRVARGFRRRWSPRWRVHTAFPNLHVCHHWYRRESAGEPSRGGSNGGRQRRAPARGRGGPAPHAGASKHTVRGAESTRRTEGRGARLSVRDIRDPTDTRSTPLMVGHGCEQGRIHSAGRRQHAQDRRNATGAGRHDADAPSDDDTSI